MYKKMEHSLTAYCDADWASDKEDRRSTTAYVVCFSRAAISWSSKKQRTVALSTTEAEYMAMSQATQEVMWLQSLGQKLAISTAGCRLLCDSNGAISVSSGQPRSSRTNHIDIRQHFVRERHLAGHIYIEQVATEDNAADMLTKAVTPEHLQKSMTLIGMTI
uniref:Reverse transcriptase Ty1/copia-type domain-containing protein n=1 Tax=Trichuris muris TaxID=70415 RepID=A0A5S6Q756_TRIMR